MSCQIVKFLYIGVLIFILSGCVPNMQLSEQLSHLELQMAEVQKTQTDIKLKVKGIDNKLFIVKERVAVNTKNLEELKSVALLVEPPDKLEVVKISPAKKDRGQKDLTRTDVRDKTKENLTKKDVTEKKIVKRGKDKPEDVYKGSYLLFEEGRSEDALNSFSDFLVRFPGHPLADNAQYWIGEIYYSQREFSRSLTEFRKVVDNYPEENKAPDALFKMALSYLELEDEESYINNLMRLLETYPDSEAAIKAEIRLNEFQDVK